MGWFNAHLHLFKVGDKEYSDPEFELEDTLDESRLTLGGAFRKSPGGFQYVYDMGDYWVHDVRLLKRKTYVGSDLPPACEGGERACPPEDVGGPWGYERFVEAISDPNHEEHEDMVEWAGGAFDPECFSWRQVNAALVLWWQRS